MNNLEIIINIAIIIFKFFLIIYFLLTIYFDNINIIINKETIIIKNDIKNIENYYKICNNGILLNNKNFTQYFIPKISIITPIHNREKYILRYLRSLQNQNFDDIEIILIDDYSTDNTLNIIEQFKKEDKRIVLIKHNKNKGTLISRNEGVLKSKGKYLIFLDPDDIISSNILLFCYNNAEKYDYDIIRFNIYKGYGNIVCDFLETNHFEQIMYQPKLFYYLYYGLGRLQQTDFFITNKFIKRTIFIKALNIINKYYLNQYMIDCEDGLINFMLYRIANSYLFSRRIGYYYIQNEQSITNENSSNIQKRIKNNFLYLKFIFQNTKNNMIEKNISNFMFLDIYNLHKELFNNLYKEKIDYKFYNEIINLYLNCEFISLNIKEILNNITIKFEKSIL